MSAETEKTYKRSGRVAWRIIEATAVIVTPDDGMAHKLNETGTWLWEALSEPATAAQLAERLAGEFAVETAEAFADVRGFIETLLARGIVLEAE